MPVRLWYRYYRRYAYVERKQARQKIAIGAAQRMAQQSEARPGRATQRLLAAEEARDYDWPTYDCDSPMQGRQVDRNMNPAADTKGVPPLVRFYNK